jgi:uncharacterized protein (TIGR03083 family)
MTDETGWAGQVALFRETASRVATLVAGIDHPGQPGLGEWTVIELAAHTMRALLTVEQYVAAAPADGPELYDASAYLAGYLGARSDDAGFDAAVAARGRDSVAALGDDAGAAFAATVERVGELLGTVDGTMVVATPIGSIRLTDYLRTRSMELVMHGLDLATALGVEWHPPRPALTDTLRLLAEAAVLAGRGEDLARLLGDPAGVLPVIR